MLKIHRNLSDTDTIACLYYALKQCGRIDDIFDGHDLLWFLEEFNQKQSYICTVDELVVGFGLVNGYGVDHIRAEVSFGFLPTCSGLNAVRLGKMMLKDVFEFQPKTRWVYGTTPSRNEKAIRFAKLIGMRVVGQIPNYLSFHGIVDDAVLTYVERESVIGN